MRASKIIMLAAPLWTVCPGAGFGQPAIQITAPTPGTHVIRGPGHSQDAPTFPPAVLDVRATVVSAEPLASVVASIEDVDAPLTVQLGDEFYGRLFIGDPMLDGDKVLEVEATTVSGQSASATVAIRYDRIPRISFENLRSPVFVRDRVRLRARCEDNSASGCTAIKLSTDQEWTAGPFLERVLDFGAESSPFVAIVVEAMDASGLRAQHRVEIYVEQSRWLREVISSDGTPVLGFDGTHALFRSCDGGRLLLRDRSGVTTEVTDDPALVPHFFAEGRVLLAGPLPSARGGPAFVWGDGLTRPVADAIDRAWGNANWLLVDELQPDTSLVRRSFWNLSTGTKLRTWDHQPGPIDPEILSPTLIGLTPNGLLLSGSSTSGHLTDVTGATRLTWSTRHRFEYILDVSSDGNAALLNVNIFGPGNVSLRSLRLSTPSGDFTLDEQSEWASGVVRDGRVAYVARSGDDYDIKLRAADGSETVLATVPEMMWPLALGDGEELLLSAADGRYRMMAGTPVRVASSLGQASWHHGWYGTVGQSVLEVLDTPDPPPAERHLYEGCAPADPVPGLDGGASVHDAGAHPGDAATSSDGMMPRSDSAIDSDAGAQHSDAGMGQEPGVFADGGSPEDDAQVGADEEPGDDAGMDEEHGDDASMDAQAAGGAAGGMEPSEAADGGDDEPGDVSQFDAGRARRHRKFDDGCSVSSHASAPSWSGAWLLAFAGFSLYRRRRVRRWRGAAALRVAPPARPALPPC